MSKPKAIIPHNALVVVADGGKAILLRNTGASGELTLHEEQRLTLQDFSNDGPSGSRPQEQTPHQTDEATFAKKLAHALFTMHEQKRYERLVLIADPQTLGQLRTAMHKTVEASLVETLSKDYTNMRTAEIQKALSH